MAGRSAEVDAFIAACNERDREICDTLRALVHEVQPDVEESIQYRMPTFSLNGAMLCGFSPRKQYFSLYCCETPALETHRAALSHLDVGKGCIRFKTLAALPLPAIRAILAAGIAASP